MIGAARNFPPGAEKKQQESFWRRKSRQVVSRGKRNKRLLGRVAQKKCSRSVPVFWKNRRPKECSMSLPDRIRQAIAPAHLRIEQTPFAQQMASGQMTRADYARGLQHLLSLHTGLESLFAEAAESWPAFGSLYHAEAMDRAGAIRRDLQALIGDSTAAEHPLIDQFVEQARTWLEQSPWSLLGVLYVLEGSRMGSMVLVRSLSRAFQVQPAAGVGLDYHWDGMTTRPQDWGQFKGVLSALPLSDTQTEHVGQAALSTMEALVDIYQAMSVATAPVLVS